MGQFEDITFQREPIGETLINEIIPLIVANKSETGSDHFELNPDFAQYEALDQHGYARLFTARKDSNLIGYQLYLINPNLNYGYTGATSTVIFIKPEHRGFGRKFIEFAESEMAKDKIDYIFQNIGSKAKDLTPFLERFGYEKTDTIYAKRLSHGV